MAGDTESPVVPDNGQQQEGEYVDDAATTEIFSQDDGNVEADEDSAFGEVSTDTTSVAEAISKGYIENGRRYQTLRKGKYWGPSDEKQFESMSAGHILVLIMDSQRSNTLFRSPLPETAQNVLDLGTGAGDWALDVADRYTHVTVRAVDLYPPPVPWTAPNCIFEVDDITKEWTWRTKFDLIHMRQLLASMTPVQWKTLYQQAYDNLVPGGWIEQIEFDCNILSDDDTLPADSILANLGAVCEACCERSGRPLDVVNTMRAGIEAVGFINVQETNYKCPIGTWPKHPIYKDAGRVNSIQWKTGLEGWVMYSLTKFGAPEPWTNEQVQVYLMQARTELAQNWHIYQKAKRVWAQKPFDGKKNGETASLGSLA